MLASASLLEVVAVIRLDFRPSTLEAFIVFGSHSRPYSDALIKATCYFMLFLCQIDVDTPRFGAHTHTRLRPCHERGPAFPPTLPSALLIFLRRRLTSSHCVTFNVVCVQAHTHDALGRYAKEEGVL